MRYNTLKKQQKKARICGPFLDYITISVKLVNPTVFLLSFFCKNKI